MHTVGKMISDAVGKAKDILDKKGHITSAERKELNELLFKIKQDINSNMPFVQTQFNKAMDKTVLEAKSEVEAFVTNKIISLGIEGLKKQNLLDIE